MYSAPRSVAIASWIGIGSGNVRRARGAAERTADEQPREAAEPGERQEPASSRIGRAVTGTGTGAPDEHPQSDRPADQPGGDRQFRAAERGNDERDDAAEQREEEQRAWGSGSHDPSILSELPATTGDQPEVHDPEGASSQAISPPRTRSDGRMPIRRATACDAVWSGWIHATIVASPTRGAEPGEERAPGFGREALTLERRADRPRDGGSSVGHGRLEHADRSAVRTEPHDPVQPELRAVGRATPLPSLEPRTERSTSSGGSSPVNRPSAGSSSSGKRSSASPAVNGSMRSRSVESDIRSSEGRSGSTRRCYRVRAR